MHTLVGIFTLKLGIPPGLVIHISLNTYTARPVCWSGWISDSYCSLKPLRSGMGEVVPARTSPTLLPHPLALCCHYPVSNCRSASIVVTSTVRVKLIIFCNVYYYGIYNINKGPSKLTLTVLTRQLMHWDTLKQGRPNYSTVLGDGGSRVGEVRAGTT